MMSTTQKFMINEIHQEILKNSGISIETASRLGIYSASPVQTKEIMDREKSPGAGMAIPYWDSKTENFKSTKTKKSVSKKPLSVYVWIVPLRTRKGKKQSTSVHGEEDNTPISSQMFTEILKKEQDQFI